jgi:hypothetical protein
MNNNILKAIALPALLIASQFASASVVLLQDNRWVTGQSPATPFSHWVNELQDSQVSTTLMQGSGSGYSHYSTFESMEFSASSTFNVRFRADQQQVLTLSATLTTTDCGNCSASSGFSLTGPAAFDSVTGLAQESHSSAAGDVTYYGSPSLAVSQLIDLAPGEYVLWFWTSNYHAADLHASSSWSFQAQFANTVVPLPATGWMLLSALGSLGAAPRLRQRRK